MAGYWKPIRAQARKETFELVRLDQPGRIVLWIAVLTAPISVVVWSASNTIEAATRALAVVGATALVGLGIYCVKLIRIPKRLADQAEKAEAANLASLRALHEVGLGEQATLYDAQLSNVRAELKKATEDLTAARAEVLVLKNPPPPARDPNGIYQLNRHVGTVHGAMRQLANGVVTFQLLDGFADFNQDAVFDYQELKLKVSSVRATATTASMGLRQSLKLSQVTCAVVG
ncbi:MAG: hypothetical protein EOO15_17720 [Chitinophagaceae bacterium]|nr:MAG: hypothetical protein EOO15_17720 [Chitinophagaceae bacterium]